MPTVTSRSCTRAVRRARVGRLPERLGLADPPVGVHRQHCRLAVAPACLQRRPHERRCGGCRPGFDQDVGLGQGQPLAKRPGQGGARHHQDSFPGDEPLQALHRGLRRRAGPRQWEQLLRLAGGAERPEPGAGATGEDDPPVHRSGRERGAMPAKVVEHPAEVRVRLDQHEEPAPGRGGGEQERALIPLERDGLHLAQRCTVGQPAGMADRRRRQRRHGIRVRGGAPVVGDRQAVHGCDDHRSTPGRSASARTTSLKLLMQGSFRCRGEALGILWSAMGEVKKNLRVDRPPDAA